MKWKSEERYKFVIDLWEGEGLKNRDLKIEQYLYFADEKKAPEIPGIRNANFVCSLSILVGVK